MDKNQKKVILKEKSQKSENKFFGFLMWIFSAELIIILIVLTIICFYKKIPPRVKYEHRKETIEIDNKNLSFTDVEKAVRDNSNLNDDEKEFIIDLLKEEVKDNYQYIDLKSVVKKLNKLSIVYEKSENYIAGRYNEFFNTIYLYENKKNLDFSSCDKNNFFHEINHLISNNSLYSSIRKDKKIISEVINEFFTRKYYDDGIENKTYEEYMWIADNLLELLPEDVIKKYKFHNDDNILIEGLLEIDNNFDKAYSLISNLNKINYCNEEEYLEIKECFKYFKEKKLKSEQ